MLTEILPHFEGHEWVEDHSTIGLSGTDKLPSCFQTTELAACSVAAAAVGLRQYARANGHDLGNIAVDRRLASLWFHVSFHPIGWQLPPPWDDIAGDYRARDGWIRLHTNAPHHKAAALSVLDCEPNRDAVANVVAQSDVTALEAAIVAANGAAAEMRSIESWQQHPQGGALRNEALVAWKKTGATKPAASRGNRERPLHGIRVLDLTRVLAGPAATRFLAGFGATVLRIDSPEFDDASNAPDMSLGKRRSRLNLRQEADRATLRELIGQADVLVHGYRSDALGGIGFDEATRLALNPNLIDIGLCAYGWSGPWAHRRGFDSLVQMSSGIADAGMRWQQSGSPYPLPLQALDHATGYLAAAAALHALAVRARSGDVLSARLSLAKTAEFLSGYVDSQPAGNFAKRSDSDLESATSDSVWGPIRRIKFPAQFERCQAGWDVAAGNFCDQPPTWS